MSTLRTGLSSLALLLAIGIFVVTIAALPARAEEGEEGGGSIEEQIKKKMEEILRLMEENEKILLRASTGAESRPKRVDIDVPQPPSKGGSAGESGTSSGASGGSASKKGEEVARKMRELIEGQRKSGGKIPGELGRLLRMIPKKQGKGQGQPQDEKGQKESQEEQEAREARKELEKKNQEVRGEDDPTKGDKSPEDPAKRTPQGGKPEEIDADGSKRDDNVPPWAAALPPEIRDAVAGGRAEDVPAKYRHLVKRYHLWLQRNKK